jgi:acetyl-CoA carboxylase biotin carboxyl carrier protein
MDDNEAARIRALGEIAAEFDLDAIRVRTGESEIEIVRREPASYAAPLPYPLAAGEAAAGGGGAVSFSEPSAPAAPSANVRRVTAPVIGVFYRSASPGADAFVDVGQRVEVGQTLCILEAMKLMNEITSEYAGVITRVLPENGQLVSLGDDLFWIEP